MSPSERISPVAGGVFTLILVVALLLGAGLGARQLIRSRPTAKKTAQEQSALLVEVKPARKTTETVRVTAMGTVIPAKEVVLNSQVSGRIIRQHPDLVPGGRFSEGEELVRIDPRDYELALDARKAEWERAFFNLRVEEGNAAIAEKEWDLLEKNIVTTEAGRDLALKKPHLRFARASLEAAESAIENASLNLERTVVKAPFNAVVEDEFVDPGQLLTPQTQIARLVGTDEYWVQTSIPVDDLSRFDIPETNGDEGSPVRIIHETGNQNPIVRNGRVKGLLGSVDAVGRMARVLVSIEDPLGLQSSDSGLPLLLGAYVRVEIEGETLTNVFAVPRTAIREGDRVWVMDENDELAIHDIEIVWRLKDSVLVANRLRDGDRIITSRIPIPIPGMKLETAEGSAGEAGE